MRVKACRTFDSTFTTHTGLVDFVGESVGSTSCSCSRKPEAQKQQPTALIASANGARAKRRVAALTWHIGNIAKRQVEHEPCHACVFPRVYLVTFLLSAEIAEIAEI